MTGVCLWTQSVDSLHQERVTSLFPCILDDDNHPLHGELTDHIIPRGGRMRLPAARTNRHLPSFVPMGIMFFNALYKR